MAKTGIMWTRAEGGRGSSQASSPGGRMGRQNLRDSHPHSLPTAEEVREVLTVPLWTSKAKAVTALSR